MTGGILPLQARAPIARELGNPRRSSAPWARKGGAPIGGRSRFRQQGHSRGVVLTLDIAIAMMVLLAAVAAAYAAFGSPSRAGFEGQMMRGYLQDAATVMAKRGSFSAPMESQNGTNTTGISEVLRATPSSVCMQVSGFGTVAGSGLIGYWKFDEDSGTVAADSSGNGHTGTISGGGSLSALGKNGRTLLLDGASGYASMGNDSAFDLSSAGTVSLWFRTNSFTNDYPHLLSRGASAGWDTPGWALFMFKSGSLGFGMRVNDPAPATSVAQTGSGHNQTGVWKHVAATWNGTRIQVYINGVYNTSAAQTVTPPSTGKTLQAGRYQESGNGWFNGSIDEVRIYSRALSADEIRLVYSNPPNLLYVVDKPECAFSGGEVQSLTVPFVSNANQDENSYYYATLRGWPSGAAR
jgi:hypothetical protein